MNCGINIADKKNHNLSHLDDNKLDDLPIKLNNESKNKEYQVLSDWHSITLEDLSNKLTPHAEDEIYLYTVASTRLEKIDGKYYVRHMGSGPNLEGGLATLCTCKRSMREGMRNQKDEFWKRLWIVGLTSRAKANGFNGKHYLFYMMKIEHRFNDHKALHEYLNKYNQSALKIKNPLTNRLGDVFRPQTGLVLSTDDPYLQPCNYEPPCKNHSHSHDNEWHEDIRKTPLLLGEENNTFVWSEPKIIFNEKRGIGCKKILVKNFIADLGKSLY